MRNFLIKPQGILYKWRPENRRTHQPSQSYGGESGGIYGVPDFIICKATANPSTDTIVSIIEVKRHDKTEEAAYEQLSNYVTAAPGQDQLTRNHPNDVGPVVGCLYAFLVLGDRTRVFTYNAELARQSMMSVRQFELWKQQVQQHPNQPHPHAPQVIQPPPIVELQSCATSSTNFLRYLTKVSLRFWDQAGDPQWRDFSYKNVVLGQAIAHLAPIVN